MLDGKNEKPVTRSELESILDQALNKKRKIDNETHFEDHEFVHILKLREASRKKRAEKFKLSFIGTIAVGFAGFLMWVGKLVVDAFSNGQHP